jgi:probable rRNA maturation factor
VIHYRNVARRSGIDAPALKRTVRSLLGSVGRPDASLSITLLNDDAIRELNRKHRGRDQATDVLSFPAGAELGPEQLLGDVVISVETARRQAADYDAALQTEIYRLLIHGLLHVLGYDHERPAERAEMEAEEQRLAKVIGMPWPYD